MPITVTRRTELRDGATDKAKKFVEGLANRFTSYVSDQFIEVYLVDTFMRTIEENPSLSLGNAAYKSASYLFEVLLEHRCGARCNGHHVAQTFSSFFSLDEKGNLENKK